MGLAGYAGFVALTTPTVTTLVVYTYDSFLGGGCGTANASAHDAVVGAFERAHRVHIDLVCPGGTLVGTLASESNSPAADAVIGLDEVTGPQAVALGLLDPFDPGPSGALAPGVAAVLGSGPYLAPYEYGYLAIDYNQSVYAPTDAAVANWSFPSVASNGTLAAGLLMENPTTDITGEEFLLWEIAFYQQVLHQPWQGFWSSVDGKAPFAPDWSTGYGEFQGGTDAPPMFVSYSIDPATNVYYGVPGYNATVGRWNGTPYTWETVYGAGVVRGAVHPGLAEDLVRWLGQGPAQAQLPLTEWEYPANASVALPAVFAYAIPPATLVPLDAQGAGTLVSDLPAELDAWQSIADRAG